MPDLSQIVGLGDENREAYATLSRCVATAGARR